MQSKEPSLRFHPFAKRWIHNYGLTLGDTNTEIGYVAKPTHDRFPQCFKFDFNDIEEDIERLNNIYGTRFDENFKVSKIRGGKSLWQIAQNLNNIKIARRVFPGINLGMEDQVYIGGISVPKRDFLYVESHKLDIELNDPYIKNGMRPTLVAQVDFIPIEKRYRPK
jgi:hypothetical protein